MKGRASWNTRRITVTAILFLTILYGADELLKDDSSSVPSGRTGARAASGPVAASPPGVRIDPEKTVRPPGPSPAALLEAERWRGRDWERADPFAGESWLTRGAPDQSGFNPLGVDTVVRATSYSSDGWRAIVGNRILRVGDDFLGGRVAEISEQEVKVRGDGWQRVLRFSGQRGD